MERCIALFTGGKESVFSLMRAKDRGYEIVELVFLEKPGFSVHKVNLSVIKTLAHLLGYDLKVIKVGSDINKDNILISFLRERKRKGATTLLTGNIKLEENHAIYEQLCKEVGLEFFEPLYNEDTMELLTKYVEMKMEFMIIGIRNGCLDPKWLGQVITKENLESFLSDIIAYGIDPCGEFGEYHSIVTGLEGLLKMDLNLYSITRKTGMNIQYVILSEFKGGLEND